MEKDWFRFCKVQNSCRVEIPKFPSDKFPKPTKSIVEKNWSNKFRSRPKLRSRTTRSGSKTRSRSNNFRSRPKPRSRTTRTGSKTRSRSSLPGTKTRKPKPEKDIAEKRSPIRSKTQKVKETSCEAHIFRNENLAIKFASHFRSHGKLLQKISKVNQIRLKNNRNQNSHRNSFLQQLKLL